MLEIVQVYESLYIFSCEKCPTKLHLKSVDPNHLEKTLQKYGWSYLGGKVHVCSDACAYKMKITKGEQKSG